MRTPPTKYILPNNSPTDPHSQSCMSSRRTNCGARQNGGRILPHERDTDDSTPLVSGGGLSKEHRLAIFTTEDQGMSITVRKDHRGCIIKWLQEHYPDVADISVLLSPWKTEQIPASTSGMLMSMTLCTLDLTHSTYLDFLQI